MPRDDAKDSCNGFAIRNERFNELRFHSFNCSDSLRFVCEKQNQKTYEKPTTSRATAKKPYSTKLTPTATLILSASSNTAEEGRRTTVKPPRIPKTLVKL